MYLNYLISFLMVAFFGACSTSRNTSHGSVEFTLDSVFINQHQQKISDQFQDAPYIFYYYTVRNHTSELVSVNIRRWDFKELTTDKAYSIFRNDTLELLGGISTPNHFEINPNSTIRIDVHPDPMKIMDLFDRDSLKDNRPDPLVFLSTIADKSNNCFEWGTTTVCDKSDRRKIIFKNPLDSAAVIWK